MYDEPCQGIFWFTCSFKGDQTWYDFSETELLALLAPDKKDEMQKMQTAPEDFAFYSRKGNAFTHKKTWAMLTMKRRDLRRYAWNYYPRGRVEILHGKAVIFMNPGILSCENFQEKLVKRFHLEGMEVRIVADCSWHYHCHGDDQNIGWKTTVSKKRRKQRNERKHCFGE